MFRDWNKISLSCAEYKGGGGVVNTSPHGDNTCYIPDTDPGGKHWWMEARCICGVFSAGTEVGDVSGRWVPGKDEQPRETRIKLHVSALEGEGENYTGATRTNA